MDRVEGILGPDIVLWQSNFFNKPPGAKEIPWHQDMNFWSSEIEPGINVSAWLAIDDTDVTNSCVQLMPGSHRKMIPHVKATPEQAFRQQGDPDHIGVDPGSRCEDENESRAIFPIHRAHAPPLGSQYV